MKNFDDFAEKFLDSPSPICDADEKLLASHLNRYLDQKLTRELIQFQKNYSMLLLEEYHKWLFSESK